MKTVRFLSVILCVAVLLCFASCGKTDTDETTTAQSANEETITSLLSTTLKSESESVPTQILSEETTQEIIQQSGLTSSSTKEEIVNEYIKIYNNTRKNPNFTGTDNMEFSNLIVDGSENKTVENSFRKLASLYSGANGIPLPPYEDGKDGVYSTQYSKTCLITADDIEQASYTDNGNGTATIRLVPKTCVNSSRYGDSQGKMFNVINFSSNEDGSFAEDLRVTNGGGWCEVTYKKSSLQMVNAKYVLKADVYLKNPNLPLLKNKEIKFKMEYTSIYPQ